MGRVWFSMTTPVYQLLPVPGGPKTAVAVGWGGGAGAGVGGVLDAGVLGGDGGEGIFGRARSGLRFGLGDRVVGLRDGPVGLRCWLFRSLDLRLIAPDFKLVPGPAVAGL